MEEREAVITYETLYELLRREKFRAEIQKLDSTFFIDVSNYLKNKEAILKSQEKNDSIFASREVDKTRTQLRNVKRIIKELYERRERKILQIALMVSRGGTVDENALLANEKELFNSLLENIQRYKESSLGFISGNGFMSEPLKEQKPLKREEELKEDRCTVRFLCAMPEFMGPDFNTYGPFEEGQSIKLPEEVAQMVAGNQSAEMIENETSKEN